MKKQFTGISVLAAGLAVVVGLGGEVAIAEGGPTGTWPDAFPLPTAPGTVISQTSTTAVVRSTDQVAVVLSKLDNLYVTENGCTLRLAVNRPKDYLCYDPATRKTDEVYFTFAALDPRPTDSSRSQTNGFSLKG
jgi:hypothetical protein